MLLAQPATWVFDFAAQPLWNTRISTEILMESWEAASAALKFDIGFATGIHMERWEAGG